MADSPSDPDPDLDTGDDMGGVTGRAAVAGTPRWVKVFGIVALVVLLLLVVVLLTGDGPGAHGPGRHTPSADTGDGPVVVVVADDHARPRGARA